jgi:hypothetical protein
MSPAARSSVGERLETAVLAAARQVNGGPGADVASWLREIELLLGVATDLDDLPMAARSSIEAALGAARNAPGRA